MNAIHGSKRQQLLQERARFMRFNPTPSEALLWSAIRGKRLGVQFRRQQVVGSAIVDFLAKPDAGFCGQRKAPETGAWRFAKCGGYFLERWRQSLGF